MRSLVALPGQGWVRCNWGTWLVDCSNPRCVSALAVGPDMVLPDGRVRRGLPWGAAGMQCWDCGFITGPIVWPRDPEAIALLLFRRPDVRTRNWEPHETLDDLLVENATHGLMPPELDVDGPSTCVMQVVDGRVVGGLIVDSLPDADARRREIAGGN